MAYVNAVAGKVGCGVATVEVPDAVVSDFEQN